MTTRRFVGCDTSRNPAARNGPNRADVELVPDDFPTLREERIALDRGRAARPGVLDRRRHERVRESAVSKPLRTTMHGMAQTDSSSLSSARSFQGTGEPRTRP